MWRSLKQKFSKVSWSLTIHDSRIFTEGEKLSSRFQRELSSFLKEQQLTKGSIMMTKTGKLEFSSEIPAKLHQQIRNIVSSYDLL